MKPIRVAIIGHMPEMPNVLHVGDDLARQRSLLQLHNFTRVLTPDGGLTDHLAYLKQQRGQSCTTGGRLR